MVVAAVCEVMEPTLGSKCSEELCHIPCEIRHSSVTRTERQGSSLSAGIAVMEPG